MNLKKLKSSCKILFSLILLFSLSLQAQSEKPTERTFKAFQIAFFPCFNYQGKTGNNVYLHGNLLFAASDEARLYNENRSLITGQIFRAGGERYFSEKSLYGARMQFRSYGKTSFWALQPYLLHNGKIASLHFGQRLLFSFENRNDVNDKFNSDALLAIFLAKNFAVGKKNLSTSLAFELRKDLTKKTNGEERRFFSGSQFFFLTEYAFFDKFSLGFFAQFATNYFFALALYDVNGKIIKPDRKLNINELYSGIVLRYGIRKNNDEGKIFPYGLIF